MKWDSEVVGFLNNFGWRAQGSVEPYGQPFAFALPGSAGLCTGHFPVPLTVVVG